MGSTYLLGSRQVTCGDKVSLSWKHLLVNVLKELYQLNNGLFVQFAAKQKCFSNNQHKLRKPEMITNDLYVNTHGDSERAVKILTDILAEYSMTGELLVKLIKTKE